jgi:peptidoglycan-associated lipoprotein
MSIFKKHSVKAVLILSSLALAACTDPGRLGGGAGGNGTGGFTPGTASDPTSPAYFNEVIGDRVLFEVDQSTLTDGGRVILQSQARWLLVNADYAAVIEGHADEQGTREYNLALGARRSNAVREYLITQGVPGARLRTLSYGKERPIEICSEEACYSKNRRSVTIISGSVSG